MFILLPFSVFQCKQNGMQAGSSPSIEWGLNAHEETYYAIAKVGPERGPVSGRWRSWRWRWSDAPPKIAVILQNKT